METSVAVLVGFALGAAAVLIGQRFFSRRPGLPPAMGRAVVWLSLDASGKPKANPDTVTLALGRELTWDIDPEMDSGEVDIDFAYQGPYKGPFEDKTGSNPHNQGRGKYVRKADNQPIHSNAAEKTGYWRYVVSYKKNDSAEPMTLDPAVCIRD